MSIEVLKHIEEKLFESKFKKTFVSEGQRVYSLGDNHFNKTKRFARYSIINKDDKYTIAAMTAVAVNGGDRVSRIDWVESARVSGAKFDTVALRICNNLLTQVRRKPNKELVTGPRIKSEFIGEPNVKL